MPGDSKAVARTVAVVALLLLVIVALRGHLPVAERPAESAEPVHADPAGVIPAFVMFGLSIVIIAIGIVTRMRRRSPALPGGEPVFDYGGGRLRVPWRLMMVTLGALLAWLLVVLLLMRWGSGFTPDPGQLQDPESGATALPAEMNRPERAATGEGTTLPVASSDGGDVFGYLGAVTILLFALSIVSALIGRRRPGPAVSSATGTGADAVARSAPDLARATALGLAEIGDRSRDPREAIIACYAAMERELEKSPVTTPQDSDTPSEVLARAVERRALRAESAAELVDLFEEARFSPHVMNESHRDDAVRALRVVQRELQGAQ